ncbi:hypothetical protein [Sphingobium sp. TCM1]|uniref:hypothetical protein n=1 Tax=Sphingobium sp. TCM1 TaxID=453246 RepID=UPI0007F53B14|nr:hypothetical protein [Sphingobium sp. TCM1]OAN51853.1 hypothetical protein A7Q26_09170 [Sphingobium sp. TCM1]
MINNFSQWQVQLSFPNQPHGSSKAKEHIGWVLSLNGMMGSFLYQPHGSGKPIFGKSLNSAAYSTTNTIAVKGWSGNQATGLEVGDYFSINNSLHQITVVPTTATGGIALIEFQPPFRKSVASNTPVEFAYPKVELRLASGEAVNGSSKDAEVVYLRPLKCVQKL